MCAEMEHCTGAKWQSVEACLWNVGPELRDH
jgi:hypothetical protein